MGKPSLAEALQYWAHRREPNGWVHQMHNDILLNFNIELEKSLLNPPNAEVGIHGGARAGTLHNRLTGGAFFRFGEIGSILPSPASRIEPMVGAYRTEKWQVWVFGKTEMRLVGYDATLNGGFFNRNSPHTFSIRQMEKLVIQSELGFVAVYKQFGLQFSYTFISPEFKSGIKHVWGGLHLIYNY
jgi:lipid A 3-O-deacylase